MAVMLRDGVPGDADALAAIVHRCDERQRDWAGDIPIPTLAECALEWHMRFRRPGALVRVAEDDGLPVGTMASAPARGENSQSDGPLIPGLAHVSAVFVDPPAWRRGIARMLLDDHDELLRAAGFRRVRLWTLEGSPAERLYTACGWTPTGERDVYPPMRRTTVRYVKELRPG